MPIIIQRREVEPEATDLDEQALINEVVKPGTDVLNVEGLVMDEFIDNVNFDDIFDNEDFRQFVTVSEGYAVLDPDLGLLVEADEDTPGAFLADIESMPAAALVEGVDQDDLLDMYGYWAVNELEEGTAVEKAIKAAAISAIPVEEINEFKRGDFSKRSRAGGPSRKMVNRMLGAMYYKGDIHRAKASAKNKYKAPAATGPATYTREYSKANAEDTHPTAKAMGKRTHQSWQVYKNKPNAKSKKAALATIGAKTTVSGKITAQSIKKGLMTKAQKQAAAKAEAKLKSKSKNKAKGGGKSLAENSNVVTPTIINVDDPRPSTRRAFSPPAMNESVALAARAIKAGTATVPANAVNG